MNFDQTRFVMHDQQIEPSLDENHLKEQLTKYNNETIIQSIYHRKQFSARAIELHVEELMSRQFSEAQIVELFEKVSAYEGIRKSNSTLPLTRAEKLSYLFAPKYLIMDMINGFENDGCDAKFAEMDSLVFVRYFTGKAWIILGSLLIGLLFMFIEAIAQ